MQNEVIRRILAEAKRERQRHYEREADRSALLWLGMILLVGLWIWAELNH